MSRTDIAWRAWGDDDPYFGVATDPKFRKTQFASHKDEFFEGGEAHIAARLATVTRLYGQPDFSGTAVDLGCGVGRLVIPLASRYQRVVGVDISPGMIREAVKNCADRGISNVEFRNRVEEVGAVTPPVGLVNSSYVFQHIGVQQGYQIVDGLLSLLAPGGMAALHLTWDRNFPPLREIYYRVRRDVPGALAVLNLIRGRRASSPMMEMNEYSVREVLRIYCSRGIEDLFCEPVYDEYSIGFVFFGRKKAA